ncbi:type IV pilus modification protein PilV [Microbulbifer hainanensis]|uniref:type IV pilus modification protein PilV n=1 Tax=Microbulbifer hainanensis TaxID=2735675 RepID=UPI0018686901|nr:type IV pilus modification protein PilV [Microbulbifer hainanensis]
MKSHAGATLIEVLVTVLILAVGLLGLAATQTMSLKNGNNSHQRYFAALAAEEMADRLRANPEGVALGAYDGAEVNGEESVINCRTPSPRCTARQLALMDLYEWGQAISTNLPAGAGRISRDGSQFTLTVDWSEQPTGTNRGSNLVQADEFSFALEVEL